MTSVLRSSPSAPAITSLTIQATSPLPQRGNEPENTPLGAAPPILRQSPRQVLGIQGEVAAEPSVAVAEAVAAQLAVDGGRVPAVPGGVVADRGRWLDQAEEGASFVE